MSNPSFMFIAGDPSGDQNTAPVIRQIYKDIPGSVCYGIGGPMMQAEGFKSLLPFEEFNRMGYLEVLINIRFFIKAKKLLIKELKTNPPQILVCVDFSGFNTQIMKAAHALGIPVLWYIAPKAWAWKKKKHTTNLKNYAAHVAVIFPFEVDFFLPYLKSVSFVGNPLVEYIDGKKYSVSNSDTGDLRKKENIRLALVPGSRYHEIENVLPTMIEAYRQLKQKYPSLSATLSTCGHIPAETYKKIVGDEQVDFFDGPLEEMFQSADLALVTSGTATLQTALMGVPMVIVYRISYISYFLCKTLIKGLTHIGLPNIIAGEEVAKELLQNDMTPEKIAGSLQEFIESPDKYKATVKKLVSLKESLGSKKPSIEVTNIIKRITGINENV